MRKHYAKRGIGLTPEQGETIKRLIKESGSTMKATAAKLRVNSVYLSRYAKGHVSIPFYHAIDLYFILGEHPDAKFLISDGHASHETSTFDAYASRLRRTFVAAATVDREKILYYLSNGVRAHNQSS